MNQPKNHSLKILAVVFAITTAILASGYTPVLPAVPSTVSSITPAEMRTHLEFLASDELGGRYTLAPNFIVSASYLAKQLKAYGFKGASPDGGFLQTFEVISATLDQANSSLSLTADGTSTTYHVGDFYSRATANGEAEGNIVFVGAGISSPAQGRDDYAGLDVKGKIVLISPGLPAGMDRSRLGENEQGLGAARAHGATGVLQVPQARLAELMKYDSFKTRVGGREQVRLARDEEDVPSITLGPALADKLLNSIGYSLKAALAAEAKRQPLQPKPTSLSAHMVVAVHRSVQSTQNVVGILEGTDPKLKNEYVAFSAHYDHLKTSPTGEVYHGADDDGSGTVAVLAIAHAMSLDRPKRSIFVIFHAGEELGLLGSEYNTDFAPAVPLDKLVVDLNIDMIGRSKPPGDQQPEDEHLTDARTVYLVGADRISRELHKLSEDTNREFQKLNLDYFYNDPNNPARIYFRSDHWNYAKHGIPVIFYFDGEHVDYHKPTDTVDKIDFNKLTQVTRLVFETGWRIANLDHRLSKIQ